MRGHGSPPIVIAAAGAPLIARLRRTFPVKPWTESPSAIRRRGRFLSGSAVTLVELPPVTGVGLERSAAPRSPGHRSSVADFVGELAFALGVLRHTRSLLIAVPGAAMLLADRVVSGLTPHGGTDGEIGATVPEPGREREILPDILVHPGVDERDVPLGTIVDETVHAAVDWASRRLAPHQVWVLAVPDRELDPATSGTETHRLLRSVVAALGEQTS